MPHHAGDRVSQTDVAAPTVATEPAPPPRSLVVDAGAFAVMGAVLFWLPVMSGGRTPAGLAGLGLMVVLAAPAAVRGVAGTSRTERIVLAALGVSLLVHPFVAGYRDGLVQPLLTYAGVPLVYLVARYVWVAWPGLLVRALPIAGAWMWLQGWSGWFAPSDTLFAAWRVVPWHNPSGILMGGVLVYAVVRFAREPSAWFHGVVAAAAGSGLWLSSSRGSIAMTALALVVVLAVHVRGRGAVVRTLVVGVATVSLTGVLLYLSPAYGPGGEAVVDGRDDGATTFDADSPFEVRNPAGGNFRARLVHVEAAWRMFERDPLVGAGLGSYAYKILDVADPRMNFTRSAHSEPVEVLGEGGLLVGVPFAVVHVALLVALTPLVLRRRSTSVTVGATAAAVLVTAHTLMDVDWAYTLVPAVAAIWAAVRARSPDPRPVRDGRWTRVTVGLLVAPVVLGLVTFGWDRVAEARGGAGPWSSAPHVERAVAALAVGDLTTARSHAAEAAGASPGDPAVSGLVDIATYSATNDVGALTRIAARAPTLREAGYAIAALVHLDPDAAVAAADAVLARLDGYHVSRVGVIREQVEDLREQAQRSSAS